MGTAKARVRPELQASGTVSRDDHSFKILGQPQELTGADRRWAACYTIGDHLRYSRGSKEFGIERGCYARVVATNLHKNLLTVELNTGTPVSYDPRRLAGVSMYRETEQPFAAGDSRATSTLQSVDQLQLFGHPRDARGEFPRVQSVRPSRSLDSRLRCPHLVR